MELFTENPFRDKTLPIKMEENTAASRDCCMLKIFYAQAGSADLSINDCGLTSRVQAPVILCLNNRECVKILHPDAFSSRIVYFSPTFVNSAFNMDNIFDNTRNLPETAILDHYYFKPFIAGDRRTSCLMKPDMQTAERLTDIFEALKAQLSDYEDHYWSCRNRSHLIELLFVIQRCVSDQQAKNKEQLVKNKDKQNNDLPTKHSDIDDILLYLNLNYHRKITIDELSKEFRTNRNSLAENFKSLTGQTVFGYLVRERINAACRLLRDTSLPVAEIAVRVGFSDLSYWGRAFKSQTGLTPSGYRKVTVPAS